MRQLGSIFFIILSVLFIYLLGLIPSFMLPIIATPMHIQSIGILISASLIGLHAPVSILLFLVLVAVGFPLLEGGQGGFELFIGPSAGMLYGYFAASLIIGLFTRIYWKHYRFSLAIFFNFLGMLSIYILNTVVFSINTDAGIVVSLQGNLVLLPADIIKVILASIIAVQFRRYYPLKWSSRVVDDTIGYFIAD